MALKNNDEIIIKSKNGIEYLQFKKLLEYNIKHCYTLKSKDLDFSEKSSKRDESFEKIAEVLEIDKRNLVRPIQTHTNNVVAISNNLSPEELSECDGLITNKKGLALVARNADCILMIFFDPINNVIANIHSGWRGTLKKISEKTIEKMVKEYRCNPENILCFICPAIRKCHFEVDEDVKDLFKETFEFLGIDKFIDIGEIKEGKQKYFIDTILINKLLLINIGINNANIIDSNICSVCECEKVHSYRVEKENKKIAASIIML